MYFKTRESCREAVKKINTAMGKKVFKSSTSKRLEGWTPKFEGGTLQLTKKLNIFKKKPKITLMFDRYGGIVKVSYKKQHKSTSIK